MTLAPGTSLQTANGKAIIIGRELGSGGQGVVYACSHGGRDYALKWYHMDPKLKSSYEAQRTALRDYILQRTAPDSRFLWPKVYVEHGLTPWGTPQYGYLMDLRESRFEEFSRVVYDRVRFPSPKHLFRTLATASVGLCDCFRRLHAAGLVYKDINDGGPFLDPATGEILVCDNDNVRVNRTPGTIFFLRFAAPEVILGQAPPTRETDRHSLAVLLFLLWIRSHPLEGLRDAQFPVLDPPAEQFIYAKEPIYAFHPTDARNRPDPDLHRHALKNFNRMSSEIQRLFEACFVQGISNPEKRPNDADWAQAFFRLRDSLFPCSECGWETVYDRERYLKTRPQVECVWCGKSYLPPARIAVGRREGTKFRPTSVVLMSPNAKLYMWHLGIANAFDAVAGEAAKHPSKDLWGIKNCTTSPWNAVSPDGHTHVINPGESVPIVDKVEINFGSQVGIVSG